MWKVTNPTIMKCDLASKIKLFKMCMVLFGTVANIVYIHYILSSLAVNLGKAQHGNSEYKSTFMI